MPWKPNRYCAWPGCTAYAARGGRLCTEHAAISAAQLRAQRSESAELYRSNAWQRLRRQQLAREPLCRSCGAEGRLREATDVDHIVPHRGDLRLFFDEKNLQSLCHSCHSRKTAREDGGFGHRRDGAERLP